MTEISTTPVVFVQEGPIASLAGSWDSRGQSRTIHYRRTNAIPESSSWSGVYTHADCPAHPGKQLRTRFVPRSNHLCCRSEPLVGAQCSAQSPPRLP